MVIAPRILPFGDAAWLIELADPAERERVHTTLSAHVAEGVTEIVPAARTVLVRVDTRILPLPAARAWIERAAVLEVDAAARTFRALEVPVVYDGADLATLAAQLDLSPEALVAAHHGAAWRVAFTGFAPGFAYLTRSDWDFDVPRHPTPRTLVPAGSVGLAREFSGAYPRATPGGWQLIGTTRAPLFDAANTDRPALLHPGDEVTFVPERATATIASTADPVAPPPPPDAAVDAALTIVAPGPRALIEDLGRPGRAAEGIAESGAADRTALRTANRLLGNRESAAAIEVTLGGFTAVAERDLWVVVAGAWGEITINDRVIAPYAAQQWPRGTELRLGLFDRGARAYIAVRGGVSTARVVGSRSTDTLSGLGPAALAAGDAVAIGDEIDGPIPPEDLHPWSPPTGDVTTISLARGPRQDWFTPKALTALVTAEWTVSSRADRVGIRLEGPELTRSRTGELASEPMAPGAIQVPPDGAPVVFGPDAPVTGGYPVIAVARDRDALGQLRPGDRVRFRWHAPGAK